MATINGTGGNDTLVGTGGNDLIRLFGGNDVGLGLGGNDRLFGGAGDDRLDGGNGHDTLWGGADDDRLFGGAAGNDRLWGEAGNDRLDGGLGNDTADGGAGNDTVQGGWGDDTLRGAAGDDLIYGSRGRDRLEGGDGRDRLWGGDDNDGLYGGNGNDRLDGEGGNDRLWGGAGNDTLLATAGNESLNGDDGNDLILVHGDSEHALTIVAHGGNGNDTIRADDPSGLGSEYATGTLFGDAGNDNISVGINFGSYEIVVFGGVGDDRVRASGGDYGANRIFGGDGNDDIVGEAIFGGNGNDVLRPVEGVAHGDAGDDVLLSNTNSGNIRDSGSSLFGDAGDDLILAGAPDEADGGAGNDVLEGGILRGGSGLDSFNFRGLEPPAGGYGYSVWRTTVLDYENGENISLARAEKIVSYDPGQGHYYGFTLEPMTRADITLARSGDDLRLSGPEYTVPGDDGFTITSGFMTLDGFFSRGLTSVTIDGVTTDVSGLATP